MIWTEFVIIGHEHRAGSVSIQNFATMIAGKDWGSGVALDPSASSGGREDDIDEQVRLNKSIVEEAKD